MLQLFLLLDRCVHRQHLADEEVATQLLMKGVPAEEAAYITNSNSLRQPPVSSYLNVFGAVYGKKHNKKKCEDKMDIVVKND